MVGCRQTREVKANTATSVCAILDVFRSPRRPYVLPEYAEAHCRDSVGSPRIPSRRAVSIDPQVVEFVDDVAEDSDAEATNTGDSSSGDWSVSSIPHTFVLERFARLCWLLYFAIYRCCAFHPVCLSYSVRLLSEAINAVHS